MTAIGNNQSVKEIVDIIQRHNHSNGRWLVAADTPVGETHVADPMEIASNAFQADGGNDTWGSWVQIVGSDDTPLRAGNKFFDFHKLLLISFERSNTPYKFQFSWGATAGAGIAADDYTLLPIITQTGIANVAPIVNQSERIPAGSKVWARVWAVGQASGTIDFWVGLHEYNK